MRPPFSKAVEVRAISARSDSVLISHLSRLIPEAHSHDHDEDCECALECLGGERLGEPRAYPGAKEESYGDQQCCPDVEMALLVIGVRAQEADGKQQRTEGSTQCHFRGELGQENEGRYDQNPTAYPEQPREHSSSQTDDDQRKPHGRDL